MIIFSSRNRKKPAQDRLGINIKLYENLSKYQLLKIDITEKALII